MGSFLSRRRTARAALAAAAMLALTATVPVAGQGGSAAGEIVAEDRSTDGTMRLRTVRTGLVTPWSVAPLPDGGALITERRGRLLLLTSLQPGTGDLRAVDGVPAVFSGGQGGLLDVALSPDYRENGTIFLSYADRASGGAVTRVARARLETTGTTPRLADMRVIFSMNRAGRTDRHFGSRLVFDDDGLLYITIGDRGERILAQDPAVHEGTVVRINPDGTVPRDNPSIGAARGVYTWGHRNPQGAARHPETGAIWVHEHGPRGGDEVNILRRGENYGWPRVSHGVAYSGREIAEADSLPGYADPLLHWTPSIAPSGMTFVTSERYAPWRGDLLVGALAGRHLRRIDLDQADRPRAQEALFRGFARIRDVRQAPDGYIYVLTDGDRASLLRLEPAR